MNQLRYEKLKRDRPFLRHKRRLAEGRAEREWNALQARHAMREAREARKLKLKVLPSIIAGIITALVEEQRRQDESDRRWAYFHTAWHLNRRQQ